MDHERDQGPAEGERANHHPGTVLEITMFGVVTYRPGMSVEEQDRRMVEALRVGGLRPRAARKP